MIGRWAAAARCAEVGDTERFFPEHQGRSVEVNRTLELCRGCEVVVQCRDWAVRNNEYGIWGGTTEKQRRDIRRGLGLHTPVLDRIDHGAPSGARAHYRLGERPCGLCARAALNTKRFRQ